MPPWRIVFAGTPDFAVPSLDALLAHGAKPVAIYTQPDRRAGRGRKLQASPVKQRALEAGLPVHQPESLKASDTVAQFGALAPDLLIVIAYGQILPRNVLSIPSLGCFNVHASVLPRWRGAAPIQRAVLAGDAETGVSVMRMDAGLDTGPVVLVRHTPISGDETAGTLHDRLAVLGAAALIEALESLAAGTLRETPQPDAGVTYARKLEKPEAWIDWSRPAEELARQVRAFNPWPVAQTKLGETVIRIWKAASTAPHRDSSKPGTILSTGTDGLLTATGQGALLIQELQLPGGRRIPAHAFAAQRPMQGLRFV
ncbi:MAG: methionyl-tRNA formyltransferase [Gammaproteobacteria bacterium]